MGEHSPIFPRSWGENSSSSRSKKEEKGCTAKGERVRSRARPALPPSLKMGLGGGEPDQKPGVGRGRLTFSLSLKVRVMQRDVRVIPGEGPCQGWGRRCCIAN